MSTNLMYLFSASRRLSMSTSRMHNGQSESYSIFIFQAGSVELEDVDEFESEDVSDAALEAAVKTRREPIAISDGRVLVLILILSSVLAAAVRWLIAKVGG